ncbi:hypothetical protein SEPCBS119000_002984 [Sporothrix epigloea]|uniref:Uncharacterized protein n=1 Tax=Sporothrix epigloea TaxID=1892477 RepID=A0ABP0DKE9_9PEZI
MAFTGVRITVDQVGARLVFVGAESKLAVAEAIKMLDNLFSRFIFTMPPPKHMLYAETDGAYHVDARYMAHVNDVMLNSTILDPSQYPTEALQAKTYKALFAKSVCLRICDVDHFRRMEISLFGPRSQPIFNDQARKWPIWFKRVEYTPKTCELAASSYEDAIASPQKPPAKRPQPLPQPRSEPGHHESKPVDVTRVEAKREQSNGVVENEPSSVENVDLLGINLLDAPKQSRPTNALSSNNSENKPPSPSAVPPIPLSYQSDTHGYQMKLLWDFVNTSSKVTAGRSFADRPKLIEANSTADNEIKLPNGPPPHHDNGTAKLIDCLIDMPTQPAATASKAAQKPPMAVTGSSIPPISEPNGLLIDIDSCPSRPATTCLSRAEQSTSTARRAEMSKALIVRRSLFNTSLCHAFRRLMADLPYSRGRIKMQVELGRIYIVNAEPEGLAFNRPGEAANGWSQSEITTRLDTICVSPGSVFFSKALTLFANDIESVLGLDDNAISQSVQNDSSGNILDRATNESNFGLSSSWTIHERRITYEFKCQQLYLKDSGLFEASSPFIIEVDGTGPGPFTYSIRSVEDTRPPIWIHCIRRHWDARVLVSYSHTDRLEAKYGDFARQLLRSMVVSPGHITSPKFQFAYDDRKVNKDGQTHSISVLSARIRNIGRFVSSEHQHQSFLDVSWNWLMKLVKRPGERDKSTGTVHATAAPDNPSRGVFTSWYEASVVSAAAEAAFRENETLQVGEVASWGTMGTAALDEMYESAFRPALQLVQEMDGVGVLVDNGQGDRQWTPPIKASQVAQAVQKFW